MADGCERSADLAISAHVGGGIQVAGANKLLLDGLQQVQGRLQLLLGLVGLHGGADDGHVLTLGSDIVRTGDHAHVDVCDDNNNKNNDDDEFSLLVSLWHFICHYRTDRHL